MKGIRVIDSAIARLRKICEYRALRDEQGRVTHEGYPTPAEMQAEMEHIYKVALRAGIKRGRWAKQ